jgi:hypothetical protein
MVALWVALRGVLGGWYCHLMNVEGAIPCCKAYVCVYRFSWMHEGIGMGNSNHHTFYDFTHCAPRLGIYM